VTVFSNTTPLFAFAALDQFELLHEVYGEIHIVEAVVQECTAGGPIIVPSPSKVGWIHVVPSTTPDPRFYMLDAGERDTLSAALSAKADLVLIDERLGRNLAEYHGLRVVGTLGTLLKAKKMNYISSFLSSVRELQKCGFWYHEPLVARLATLVGEN